MLYSRYGAGAKDILAMDYEIGMDVLVCAQNQKAEEMLFNQWMHSYSDKSYEDWKRQIGYRPQIKEEIVDEKQILDDVRKIMGG